MRPRLPFSTQHWADAPLPAAWTGGGDPGPSPGDCLNHVEILGEATKAHKKESNSPKMADAAWSPDTTEESILSMQDCTFEDFWRKLESKLQQPVLMQASGHSPHRQSLTSHQKLATPAVRGASTWWQSWKCSPLLHTAAPKQELLRSDTGTLNLSMDLVEAQLIRNISLTGPSWSQLGTTICITLQLMQALPGPTRLIRVHPTGGLLLLLGSAELSSSLITHEVLQYNASRLHLFIVR
ncbi:Hypothetical predicted protein [Pelobates cultripes]|uniref:Uncharacterized protein n=1 Tax=Pelobates cultripes TaxID=61616 RepID=A0AAD1S0N5_PELCU|nr:Hypothetical predicted protein [Pelobates cultripes]